MLLITVRVLNVYVCVYVCSFFYDLHNLSLLFPGFSLPSLLWPCYVYVRQENILL